MKKSLVLAMAMALGVTASAYAANPFSDVPAGHWAYDSVAKLAAAGVVDGYADGAFAGDKLITRYEMAQIVAKAMAKGADCDKLAAEFADELDTLGVRVAKLEKKADNVKISGEARFRYWDFDGNAGKTKTNLRTRIFIKGAINEDWTATAMLENSQKIAGEGATGGEEGVDFQRAYVEGKLGGMKVTAGRYYYKDFNDGVIYDDRVDGVQVSYGKDVKVTAAIGKGADKKVANAAGAEDKNNNAEDMAYVQVATKLGMVDAKAGYYKFDTVYGVDGRDFEIYTLGAGLPLAKDLKVSGYYLFNESEGSKVTNDDNGYVVALNYKKASAAKPGSWAAWANYYYQPTGTYVAHTFEADDFSAGKFFGNMTGGFEGYGVGVDYAIAKNVVAQVKYYALEAIDNSEYTEDTLYAQVNFTF